MTLGPAIWLASFVAGTLGLCIGILEAGALAYADFVLGGPMIPDGVALILLWIIAGWVAAFLWSIWVGYRARTNASVARYHVARDALLYAGALAAWTAIVQIKPLTTSEAIRLVSLVPLGTMAFMAPIRLWVARHIGQYWKPGAVAMIGFGMLMLAGGLWPGLAAVR